MARKTPEAACVDVLSGLWHTTSERRTAPEKLAAFFCGYAALITSRFGAVMIRLDDLDLPGPKRTVVRPYKRDIDGRSIDREAGHDAWINCALRPKTRGIRNPGLSQLDRALVRSIEPTQHR